MSKQLHRFNWKTHNFFGIEEAQRILDMGPAAFVRSVIRQSRIDALFFIPGAAFDLGCNGCGKEALQVLIEGTKYFPDADFGLVAGYIQAVHNSGERESVKTQFADKIHEKYDILSHVVMINIRG